MSSYHHLNAWANYHGHSFFCDGHEAPEAYIKKAIELGLKTLGISSHAPVPFDTDWNMPQHRLPEYLKMMSVLKQKYKKHINVLTSMEVDYIPGLAGPAHGQTVSSNLDYVIGSIHFVEKFPDNTHFSIDSSTENFIKGVREIFGGDVKKTVKRYFELQKEMLEKEPPHIIGHLDKIRMHNRKHFFFDEKASWYVNEVYETIALAAEKGIIVEINTKYFNSSGQTFPSRDHFKWMAEKRIPLTLSSDAHLPDKLLSGFVDVIEMLEQNGIKHLWHYHDNDNGQKFSPRKFDRSGIEWS
jgi:histidinol-phosphatase (PHP family)